MYGSIGGRDIEGRPVAAIVSRSTRDQNARTEIEEGPWAMEVENELGLLNEIAEDLGPHEEPRAEARMERKRRVPELKEK